MKHRNRVVEVVGFLVGACGGERNCEVVAERVDDDDNGLLKSLGMPAPRFDSSGGVRVRAIDWRYGTLRLVVQDQPREEEAAREEVNAQSMEDTATCQPYPSLRIARDNYTVSR